MKNPKQIQIIPSELTVLQIIATLINAVKVNIEEKKKKEPLENTLIE